jgi:signal transduction histidine kinase
VRRNSLFARLLLSGALWALPLLIAAAIGLSAVYRAAIYSNLDDELAAVVTALIANVEVEADGAITAPRFADPRLEGVFSGRYWQIDVAGRGEPAARSESLFDEQLDLPAAALEELRQDPGARRTLEARGPNDEPLRIIAESIILPNLSEPMIASAAADRSPAERAVRRFTFAAIWMLAAFAAILILALIFQTRIGLAPLARLRQAVADVREGRTERLPGGYPEEIAPLADELNSLIGHNRDVVDRARTHAGNLAHALKTPIAVLLNESRARPDDFGQLVQRQAGAMAEQVDHHLRRARAAARGRASSGSTQVGQIVSDIARTVQRIYRDKNLSIEVDCPPSLTFHGERQDLEEMVGNLLDNAGKWAAGAIRVSAAQLPDKELEIRFEDDGSGLPAERRAEAIQRGARLDETAPGTGLGLAIVSDLAEAYGGSLSLHDSEMGGLKASLRLPAAL